MNNITQLLNLIKYPCLTEKAMNLYAEQKYTFIVDKSLTKTNIKFLIEKIFNVSVKKINICNLPVKKRRIGRYLGKRSIYKKALVSLKAGNTISELFN